MAEIVSVRLDASFAVVDPAALALFASFGPAADVVALGAAAPAGPSADLPTDPQAVLRDRLLRSLHAALDDIPGLELFDGLTVRLHPVA